MGEPEEVPEECYFEDLEADSDLESLGPDDEEDELQLPRPKTPDNTRPAPRPKPSKFFDLTHATTPLVPETTTGVPHRDSPQPEPIFQKYDLRNKLKPSHLAFALCTEKSNVSRQEYLRWREAFNLAHSEAKAEAKQSKSASNSSSSGDSSRSPSPADHDPYADNDRAGESERGSIAPDVDIAHKDSGLPMKMDTLKRRLRKQIPLLKMFRFSIPVEVKKQPSLARREKNPGRTSVKTWLYWYCPKDLTSWILSSRLTYEMHFGLAHYVDRPKELYHSLAWGSSVRSSSGENVASQAGDLLISGDIVRIPPTVCQSTGRIHTRGRIVFIGKDYRGARAPQLDLDGSMDHPVIVTLQAVVSTRKMLIGQPDDDDDDDEYDDRNDGFVPLYSAALLDQLPFNEWNSGEQLLIEDELIEIRADEIKYHMNVEIDRKFSVNPDGRPEEIEEFFYSAPRTYIRRVANLKTMKVRELLKMPPARGELEVEEFGRAYLEGFFGAGKKFTSLPYQLFIDGFAIHRNNYRSLGGFYNIPSSLPYEARRRVANIFTLTLSPHGSDMKDVVKCIGPSINDLDRGCQLRINGEDINVSVPSLLKSHVDM